MNMGKGVLRRVRKGMRRELAPTYVAAIAVMIAFALIAQTCAPTPTAPTPTDSVGVQVVDPPPFEECSGGDEETPLDCLADSLKDENGQRVEVRVVVPWQGRKVTVETEPFDEKQALSAEAPFTIRRLITNFEVTETEGRSLTQFNPAIELRVEYTAEHWDSAIEEGEDRLRLAYWIPGEEQWREFTEEKHNLTVDPGEDGDETNGGFLVAEISEWGDPVHGTGP